MNDKIQTSFLEIIEKIEGWITSFIENLPNIIVAVIVLIISYYTARIVNRWVVKIASKRISQNSIANLIGRISSVFVVLVGLFLALGAIDLSKTLNTLLAGAGISGLVIGLALQGTLSNLLSGVVLSFRKKIGIGHWIETTGYSGEVIDINLNSVVLKEFDNNLVVIPNKTIVENPFKNYSLTSKMRIMVTCGVGYESDLEKVEKLTKDAVANLYKTDNDSEIEFYFTEFADSSINFTCRFWVDAENAKNKLDARSAAIKAIKESFNANEINIPFPIRTLEFNSNLNVNSIKN